MFLYILLIARIHVLKIRSSFFPTHFFSPFSSALPSPLRSKTQPSFTPPLSLPLLFSFRPRAFHPSTMAPSKTPGGTERKKGGFRPSDHFRPANIRPVQKTSSEPRDIFLLLPTFSTPSSESDSDSNTTVKIVTRCSNCSSESTETQALSSDPSDASFGLRQVKMVFPFRLDVKGDILLEKVSPRSECHPFSFVRFTFNRYITRRIEEEEDSVEGQDEDDDRDRFRGDARLRVKVRVEVRVHVRVDVERHVDGVQDRHRPDVSRHVRR